MFETVRKIGTLAGQALTLVGKAIKWTFSQTPRDKEKETKDEIQAQIKAQEKESQRSGVATIAGYAYTGISTGVYYIFKPVYQVASVLGQPTLILNTAFAVILKCPPSNQVCSQSNLDKSDLAAAIMAIGFFAWQTGSRIHAMKYDPFEECNLDTTMQSPAYSERNTRAWLNAFGNALFTILNIMKNIARDFPSTAPALNSLPAFIAAILMSAIIAIPEELRNDIFGPRGKAGTVREMLLKSFEGFWTFRMLGQFAQIMMTLYYSQHPSEDPNQLPYNMNSPEEQAKRLIAAGAGGFSFMLLGYFNPFSRNNNPAPAEMVLGLATFLLPPVALGITYASSFLSGTTVGLTIGIIYVVLYGAQFSANIAFTLGQKALANKTIAANSTVAAYVPLMSQDDNSDKELQTVGGSGYYRGGNRYLQYQPASQLDTHKDEDQYRKEDKPSKCCSCTIL